MKSITAILALSFMLGLCSLTSRSNKNANKAPGTKEEVVKARLTELFDLCKASKNLEAAWSMMYRGPDKSRDGKDTMHYSACLLPSALCFNERDRKAVDETCKEIKTNIDRSDSYTFGKFLTQLKSDGSEVVAWEVYFRRGSEKRGEIYAFSLLYGEYVLVDIDPIAEERTELVTSTLPPAPPPGVDQNPTPRKPPASISGGVLNGKATSLPPPAYPPIAKAAHAGGTVTVQVVVDEEGKVISAHAVSGHPLLQAAAVQAARQARFAPTKLSGQTVKVTGVLVYNFQAQ